MNKPKPKTARSPNLSTKRPETSPDENLTIAKLEIINPIAVLLTPKEAAKIGIAGIINPNPTATKNETDESLLASETKQSKIILETKNRDKAREIWFKENNKKLIVIWENEIDFALEIIQANLN